MRHRHVHHAKPRRRGLISRITGIFRARQIYLRSDGQVRFFALKPWHQVAALVFGMAGLFWVAYASINVAFKDQLLVVKERRLYQARLEYEDRIAQLRHAIDRMNDKLLLDQGEYLDKVDAVRADYDKLVRRQRLLSEFFHQGWMPTQPEPATRSTGDKQPPKDKQGSLNVPGDSFKEPNFREKYATAFHTPEEVLAPLADMHRLFQAYDDKEASLLEDVVTETAREASNARRVFARLGIDAKAVIAGSFLSQANTGGPLVAASAADLGSGRISDLMGQVTSNLAEIEKLRYEGSRMPVWLPLHKVERITSPFGVRSDPLLHVAALHTGIDFKAPYGSEVLATASGKVVQAGWDGGYGRLVEIDHGFGVSTRFAHLKAIKVKVGQHVKRGEVIGLLGDTGRSTGYHLHYETRVNGRPINPVRFWKVRDELQAISD